VELQRLGPKEGWRVTLAGSVKKTSSLRSMCHPNLRKEKSSMAKKIARATRKPWTKDHVKTLKAHSKNRTPVSKISKEMKRTVAALRRMAGKLGIGLGHQR
jgi:hypothetical protein